VRISHLLAGFDRLFLHAERATALLDRCRPVNWAAEIARLTERWEAGNAAEAAFRYLPNPELLEVRSALVVVREHAPALGPLGALYAARARELEQEAAIVEAIGTPEFASRASARFPADAGEEGTAAVELARIWVTLPGLLGGTFVDAADAGNPLSLLRVMSAMVGELRLPVRVTTSDRIACAAAAGDGFVAIREGVAHRPEAALRIAVHEVHGHLLPRHRARTESLGLLAAGTAGSAEDEEGRALLLEDRRGLMDADRRRELAIRHFAALGVRDGATFVDTVRLGLGFGLAAREAVGIAARVHRGGGLAREIVYLPAFRRVRAALAEEPGLERWLERGRVSLAAARVLDALPRDAFDDAGDVHSNTATTGV
jgi:hypothetical protein